MFNNALKIAAAGLLSVAMFHAHAQQDAPTPEELAQSATETRQGLFKLLSYNMGPINGMARNTVEFDAEMAERNARRVAALAPMIPELFSVNDTRNFPVATQAEPTIWDNMDDFRQKAVDLEEAALTFADVAAGGNRNQTIAAIRAFGATCGNCHRPYRDN